VTLTRVKARDVNPLVSATVQTPPVFGLVVSTYVWTPPERGQLNLGKVVKIVDTSCQI